jgi:hypothetical protein
MTTLERELVSALRDLQDLSLRGRISYILDAFADEFLLQEEAVVCKAIGRRLDDILKGVEAEA